MSSISSSEDCGSLHDTFWSLYPVVPQWSTRYQTSSSVFPQANILAPGSFSSLGEPEPQYLPLDWSVHVQAEGQRYFYNKKSHVVTECDLYHQENVHRIGALISFFEKTIASLQLVLPHNSELFLQMGFNGDPDGCGYYFVDHDVNTTFWLSEVSSEDMGFSNTSSHTQLRWGLVAQYWIHVEYFSAHLGGIPMKQVNELLGIIAHGRADQTTSSYSTFPYSAAQCTEFSNTIGSYLSYTNSQHEKLLSNEHLICVVARVWSQVAHHRMINFYGEATARLSRDQSILQQSHPSAKSVSLWTAMLSVFLFGQPKIYLKKLQTLWVDELVYSAPWQTFVAENKKDWKFIVPCLLGSIGIQAILLSASLGLRDLHLASMAITISGLLVTLALQHYHVGREEDVTEAAAFLARANKGSLGFLPISVVYGLPKASLLWSIVFLALQTIAMGLGTFGLSAGLFVAFGIIALVGSAVKVLRDTFESSDANDDAEDMGEAPKKSTFFPKGWFRFPFWYRQRLGDIELGDN